MRTAVRSVAFVLLALACAALIVLLTPALPALPSPSDSSTTANADVRAPAHGNLATPNGIATAGDERERAVATAAAPSTSSASAQLQLLRVIDGATGIPLPHATVLFCDARVDYQQLPSAEVLASWDDPEAFAQKHGQRAQADNDGRVAIHVHGFCHAYGRLGERFGEVEFGGGNDPAADPRFPGEVVLRLFAEQTLRLRLVGEDGKPVVGLVVRGEVASDRGPVPLPRPFERVSDEDGRVVFLHLQQQLQVRAGAPADARTLAVEVVCVGGGGPRRTFDARDLPRDEVELRLPACGELRIAVLQADGAPWSYPGSVLLELEVVPLGAAADSANAAAAAGRETSATVGERAASAATSDSAVASERGASTAPANAAARSREEATVDPRVPSPSLATDGDRSFAPPSLAATSHEFVPPGPVRVTGVRCGLRFRIGDDLELLSPIEVDGPQHAGERRDVAVRLHPDLRILCGRLLDADGRPFVGEAQLSFQGEGGSGGMRIRHDADGHFTVLLDGEVGDAPRLEVHELDFRRSSPRSARVRLAAPLRAGRNDLGDVVLTKGPLLVAGRLQLPSDFDVARAQLQVVLQYSEAPRFVWWSEHRSPIVQLDAQHAFVVHHRHDGHRWRLVVRGDCVPMAPIPFAPGARDVVVPVTKPAVLTATFVPDPLLEHLELRLAAIASLAANANANASASSNAPDDDARGAEPEPLTSPDGHVARIWRRLAGGPHRLLASLPGGAPLWQLDVDVPAGGVADDPRLRGIDLRGRAELVRLVLREADGTPFAGSVTLVVPERALVLAEQNGPQVVVAATDARDVWVLPQGRCAQRVVAPRGDVLVVVAAAAPFAVAWPSIAELPPGVVAWLRWSLVDAPDLPARVRRVGGARGRGGSELLGLTALPTQFTDGRAAGTCNAVGPVQAQLVLTRDEADAPEFVVRTATIVDPANVTAGALVPLLPDAGELAAARAQLRR